MCPISLLMYAKFAGNSSMRLLFMAVFLQVCEKKNEQGMAIAIYFKSGI